MNKHTERRHAKYSASSSDRWLNCTGSVSLINQLPKRPPNKYADRGTALHALAETMLLFGNDEEFHEGQLLHVRPNETYELTEEDIEGVKLYVDLIRDYWHGSDVAWLEEELDLAQIHPLVGGNVDCAVVKGSRLSVFDFKSGRGAVVYPEENPQELQYGVGAYLTLPEQLRKQITEVELVIVQPYSAVAEPVRKWLTTPMRLIEQIASIQHAVEEAENGGQLRVGEWCEYCPAAGVCPALHNMNEEVVETVRQQPVSMTTQQIGELLWKWKYIEPMMESLLEQAKRLAEAGVHVPGFKLEKRRARYAWSDEVMAKAAMRGVGMSPEQMFVAKLASPAQVKKIVGKDVYNAELLPLVQNTSTGYNLVLDDQFGKIKGPSLEPKLPSLAQLLPAVTPES